MNDPNLNNLLKWSVTNSNASRNDPSTTVQPLSESEQAALASLLGGNVVSPFDDMLGTMEIIESDNISVEEKVDRFEHFADLVFQIDNAHNLEKGRNPGKVNNEGETEEEKRAKIPLWTRLADQLSNKEPKLRALAASCCGIAVENNIRSQERLLVNGTIPILVKLATRDDDLRVRKSAITALSKTSRNFQPGLDAILAEMPDEYKPQESIDANDMDSVDILTNKLRQSISG